MKVAYLKPEKAKPEEPKVDVVAMYQADIRKAWKKYKDQLIALGYTEEKYIERITKELQ
ncbi:hypothetical protein [Pedobacter sp. SYP-B3415]|uniref:hypothetical protein n=1 Tax=Pedobacter sp. SYP-B3415 TaxID=2496641 RepID=UPI0013EDBA22|nr:hypothetical protein [Pedobacter sp. SYP-B3415]